MKGFTILRSAIAALMLCLFMPVSGAVERAWTETPALWEIQGAKGRIYLLGSIHILPSDMKWRSPAINKAFDEAETFVFEIDMPSSKDPKTMQPLLLKYGLLPEGQTLQAILPKERYVELKRAAEKLGIPIENLNSMRPWLTAVTLTMQAIVQAGYDTSNGVDLEADTWARANGKKIESLETVELQMKMFADLPREREIELLRVSLDDEDDIKKILSDMDVAYAKGDVVALEKLFNSNLNEFPSLRNVLLKDRHDKWLPKIEKMMKTGRTHVIVVGIAHLVGPDSIVARLRAKGIKVEGP